MAGRHPLALPGGHLLAQGSVEAREVLGWRQEEWAVGCGKRASLAGGAARCGRPGWVESDVLGAVEVPTGVLRT